MNNNLQDNFKDAKEFWYISKDADASEKGVQRDDKVVATHHQGSTRGHLRYIQKMVTISEGLCQPSTQSIHGY